MKRIVKEILKSLTSAQQCVNFDAAEAEAKCEAAWNQYRAALEAGYKGNLLDNFDDLKANYDARDLQRNYFDGRKAAMDLAMFCVQTAIDHWDNELGDEDVEDVALLPPCATAPEVHELAAVSA